MGEGEVQRTGRTWIAGHGLPNKMEDTHCTTTIPIRVSSFSVKKNVGALDGFYRL